MNEIGNYTLHNLVEIFVPLQTIFVSYCGCFVYLCECMCSIVASVVSQQSIFLSNKRH